MTSPTWSVRMLASPSASRDHVVLGLMKSFISSSSSSFFLERRWSNQTSVSGTRCGVSGSHVSFHLVLLTLPSRWRSPWSSPPSPFGLRIKALPQSISVTSSPSLTTAASAASRSSADWRVVAFVPAGGYFLCFGMVTTSGSAGPLVSVSFVIPSVNTATWRGHTGSISFLFMAQSLSHSIKLVLRLAPCERMKSRRTLTLRPRRLMPCTVGKRGSSQPSTKFWSTNHCSLRFERVVDTKLSRE
mmetsp:Transcript_20495/g.66557  ORF Transcript_20495/g.66557 Transcript_20495/m.66557 type:complete len:244 (-) Transcript_20495:1425-2156(-)